MLLTSLILTPVLGIFAVSAISTHNNTNKEKTLKTTALIITSINFVISLIIFILYDNSNKNFQFIQEHYDIGYYEFFLGIDGLSIYFVLLTTLIMPIAIISNWKSIKDNATSYLLIILLLETSLLIVFLVLDILMFYIFFESILGPLFILIGIYGSYEKVRAGFYFFLYTLLGSLFMLLSIITMLSSVGSTCFDILSKTNFLLISQIVLFIGIFIAFAVKTPVIYLNSWLLKAHVESPLSGSIILAAIVLKLSLYGIFRLILILLPKAYTYCTTVIFVIGALSIIYASLSTLRTIDVKELIAYSSVSHAAVYLLGVLTNVFHGIQGAIILGLAHGFVSSGLFTAGGGVLYDRSGTRLMNYYRGIVQAMPIFCVLFFILCLGNCGAPLTLNFLGEFLCLYGVFERLPVAGALASSSIVLSAAYTIYMYNRIAFAGSYPKIYWTHYIPDINKREYHILLALVIFTVLLGIYPAIILDGLHYSCYCLLYTFNSLSSVIVNFDVAVATQLSELLPDYSRLTETPTGSVSDNGLNNYIIYFFLAAFSLTMGIYWKRLNSEYIITFAPQGNFTIHKISDICNRTLTGLLYFNLWNYTVHFIAIDPHYNLYNSTYNMPNDDLLLQQEINILITTLEHFFHATIAPFTNQLTFMRINDRHVSVCLDLLRKKEALYRMHHPDYVSALPLHPAWENYSANRSFDEWE